MQIITVSVYKFMTMVQSFGPNSWRILKYVSFQADDIINGDRVIQMDGADQSAKVITHLRFAFKTTTKTCAFRNSTCSLFKVAHTYRNNIQGFVQSLLSLANIQGFVIHDVLCI